MEELIRTNDPTIIAFAQALLSGEDIDCYTLDVNMSVIEAGLGIVPQRLFVKRKDLFMAKAVLRDNDIEV